MEIRSTGLRVIFRNKENKRTCEVTYKYNQDRWFVKCYILDVMTTDLTDALEWPIGDDPKREHGIPMLNSYESMIDALEAYKIWAK